MELRGYVNTSELPTVTFCNKFVIFLLTSGNGVAIMTIVTSCNKFVTNRMVWNIIGGNSYEETM